MTYKTGDIIKAINTEVYIIIGVYTSYYTIRTFPRQTIACIISVEDTRFYNWQKLKLNTLAKILYDI